MKTGILLDVVVERGWAALWVKTGEGRTRIRVRHHPDFYVAPRSREEFTRALEEHPHILDIQEEPRYASLEAHEKTPFTRVVVDSPGSLPAVARLAEKYGEVFDADLSPTQRFIADHGLVPLGEVEAEVDGGEALSLRAPPPSLGVAPPPLEVLCFRASLRGQPWFTTYLDGVVEEETFRGGDALQRFLEYVEWLDPDIVAAPPGQLRGLLEAARRGGYTGLGAPEEAPRLLGGRVYVGFEEYGRLGLAGLVERVMYTREVPRLSFGWAAGRAIESRQRYEARRRGIVVARCSPYQPVLSLGELLREDQGGLIFPPTVGLHGNVAALDFESMYPSLIVKHNISYEDAGEGASGFLAGLTEETLRRRLYYKHLRGRFEEGSREWYWCELRQKALKEVLFCTYGYSGCWANRFGNMETFMEVNRAARRSLVEAMSIARGLGYKTLYGNCDSLFLHRRGASRGDYEEVAERIQGRLGLPMALENHFRFLVLLPSRVDPWFGAINRYYGVCYDGRVVCRGLMLRRRDVPRFVAGFQLEAVKRLLDQPTLEDVATRGVAEVLGLLEEYKRRVRLRKVAPEELEAWVLLRRRPGEYRSAAPHVAAARALELNGEGVSQGDLVGYVFVGSGSGNPFRRVSPAGYSKGYDVSKYQRLLEEAAASILTPIQKEHKTAETTSLDKWL